MANEVSIFARQTGVTTIPGERKLSKLAQSLASASTSRRIQTNTNGTFKKLVNGEVVGTPIRGEINVIIVGALPQVSRVYYREKFDPNKEPTVPNCWSNLGDTPESGVPDKQHDNCADCPMNIKGSGDNGGRACRFQRRIAVLLADDPSGEVYQFNIPSKSLFGKGTGNVHPFESYVKFLIANGESPDNVVTNVAYDLNADSMELLFMPVRNISDDEYNMVIAAQARPETENYTKITVSHADGVTKKPPTADAKPAEKPAAVRVQRSEEPDDEAPPAKAEVAPTPEPAKEPIRRQSAKKETPPAVTKESLTAVLSEWADEDAGGDE